MPVYHAYADDDGYFIRARPSDAGNVTYQVEPLAATILEKIGYSDGDDIDWKVIDALRLPSLVDTGDSGTTEDKTPKPLNGTIADTLSQDDIKQLLAELESIPQVDEATLTEIESLFDVSLNESSQSNLNGRNDSSDGGFDFSVDIPSNDTPTKEIIFSSIKNEIQNQGIMAKRHGELILPNNAGPSYELSTQEQDFHGEITDYIDFQITITAPLAGEFEGGTVSIYICVSDDGTIGGYYATVTSTLNTELRAKILKLLADFLPIIVSEFENSGCVPDSAEPLQGSPWVEKA